MSYSGNIIILGERRRGSNNMQIGGWSQYINEYLNEGKVFAWYS